MAPRPPFHTTNSAAAATPPTLPHIQRKIRLTILQWLCIPLLLLIPALALCDIIDGRATTMRVAIMYVFLWACFRSIGKRELSKMSPFELITLITIPSIFSRALVQNDLGMVNAIAGASTLLALVFLTSLVGYRSERMSKILRSYPTVLAHDGQLIEDRLNEERISPDDIASAMHRAGIEDLARVRWAILQSNGTIAIVPDAHTIVSRQELTPE